MFLFVQHTSVSRLMGIYSSLHQWVRFYLCGNGTKPVVRRYPGCDTGCGVLALQLLRCTFPMLSTVRLNASESRLYISLSLSLSLFVDNSERKTCPPSGFERRSNDFRGDPGALLSTKRFLADRQVPDSRKSVTSWHIRKSWRGTDRLELFLTATWTILGIKITLI